jgi:hypothetical protein
MKTESEKWILMWKKNLFSLRKKKQKSTNEKLQAILQNIFGARVFARYTRVIRYKENE